MTPLAAETIRERSVASASMSQSSKATTMTATPTTTAATATIPWWSSPPPSTISRPIRARSSSSSDLATIATASKPSLRISTTTPEKVGTSRGGGSPLTVASADGPRGILRTPSPKFTGGKSFKSVVVPTASEAPITLTGSKRKGKKDENDGNDNDEEEEDDENALTWKQVKLISSPRRKSANSSDQSSAKAPRAGRKQREAVPQRRKQHRKSASVGAIPRKHVEKGEQGAAKTKRKRKEAKKEEEKEKLNDDDDDDDDDEVPPPPPLPPLPPPPANGRPPPAPRVLARLSHLSHRRAAHRRISSDSDLIGGGGGSSSQSSSTTATAGNDLAWFKNWALHKNTLSMEQEQAASTLGPVTPPPIPAPEPPPPRRFGLGYFRRRQSFNGKSSAKWVAHPITTGIDSGKMHSSEEKKTDDGGDDDENDEYGTDDPLNEMLYAHQTQRVRFDLGGGSDANGEDAKKAQGGATIVAFMSRILFGGGGAAGAAESGQKSPREDSLRTGIGRTRAGSSPEASTLSSPTTNDAAVNERVEQWNARAEDALRRQFNCDAAFGYYQMSVRAMTEAAYDDSHPLLYRTLSALHHLHHVKSSLANSASIVKMGIRFENRGEFVRALKMYTIAYRIRRDAVGSTHPSLPVLLNMLGSVQVKRGEMKEAMKIFQLALEALRQPQQDLGEVRRRNDLFTSSVTLRDMGIIQERWGNDDKALELHQESLDCVARMTPLSPTSPRADKNRAPQLSETPDRMLDEVRVIQSHATPSPTTTAIDHLHSSTRNQSSPPSLSSSACAFYSKWIRSSSVVTSPPPTPTLEEEKGEVEAYIGSSIDGLPIQFYVSNQYMATTTSHAQKAPSTSNSNILSGLSYQDLLPPTAASRPRRSKGRKGGRRRAAAAEENGRSVHVNVAMTLHQVAQIYRRKNNYAASLATYRAALGLMKHALGDRHANVAAILGNMGNLEKAMGNYDEAYRLYQSVLGIEVLHLGLNHPEVVVTLHNIATIQSSRGLFRDAVVLYRQVRGIQRSMFGPHDPSVAVTAFCLADVLERMGEGSQALAALEEVMRIRCELWGKQHVDIGRLWHKIAVLAQSLGQLAEAHECLHRALRIYQANRLPHAHVWRIAVERDLANLQAARELGQFESACEF